MRVGIALALASGAQLAGACGGGDVQPWSDGELVIEQIGLTGEAIGEAALVVGPDGTTVLIDVGNDCHADLVIEALERHAAGTEVDHVLLTHYHADHIGGFDELFEFSLDGDRAPVSVREQVLTRGMVDIGAGGANRRELESVCTWADAHADRFGALCEGDTAPCGASAPGGPWLASSCPGLGGALASIPLGEGASLTVFAVSGWAPDEEGFVSRIHDVDDRLDDPGENGRSMVGVIRHGDFAMVFGGDLTGGGKDTPDVEAAVVASAEREGHPVPPGGVDVVKLNHHGIDSSTGEAWLEWLLPGDGQIRHALVGASSAYLSAPAPAVVERTVPRLGGGSIWVTRRGSVGSRDERVRVARGSVLIRVAPDGASYAIELARKDEPAWEGTAISID